MLEKPHAPAALVTVTCISLPKLEIDEFVLRKIDVERATLFSTAALNSPGSRRRTPAAAALMAAVPRN
jgi:hypothetical protein